MIILISRIKPLITLFLYIIPSVCSLIHGNSSTVIEQPQTFELCSVSTTNTSQKSYSSIEELKSSNVSSGTTVRTTGFFKANDYGGAIYNIAEAPLYPLETNMSIALNNGLYANMQFSTNSVINIQSFGLTDGSLISGTLNSVLPIVSGKIDGIKFSSGIFYVDAAIFLHSINLYGTSDSAIVIDEKYAPNLCVCLSTPVEESNSIGLYNLHIIANINNNFARKNVTTLVYLRSITKCVIEGCTFESNAISGMATYIPINLVWFQGDSVSNVSITNSNFYNNTGLNYQPGTQVKLPGGCLWFSGETLNAHMKNISIYNCNFSNTNIDELMGVWKGNYENISIKKCSFSNSCSHISNNFMTFCEGKFKNINISDTKMQFNSSTMCPVKFTNFLGESDFTVDNCDFTFSFNERSNPDAHSRTIFYIDEDQLTAQDIPIQLTINNSRITSTSDNVQYRSIVQCKNTTNKSIKISNSKTNISSAQNPLDIAPNNTVSVLNSPDFY